jgi:hypothetical protein
MAKVIMLDCDGVLNSRLSLSKAHYRDGDPVGVSVDPHMLLLVLRACRDTGAKVVVSSSWRHSGECMDYLTERIRDLDTGESLVIGKTPVVEDEMVRGKEISAWLSLHPEVTSYAILDDDADAGEGHGGSFFKTSFSLGLTEAISSELTSHLNSHGLPESGDVRTPEEEGKQQV